MTEAEQRAAVVAAARGWIGTNYHHEAAVKGAGVDCAYLLIEAFAEAGVVERFRPAPYPRDWHMHRSEELYVQTIERFAVEFDWQAEGLKPADVVVWRYGRTFSHGGIVSVADPLTVIHAFAPYRVVVEAGVSGSEMGGREMRAFRFWGG